MLVSRLVPLLVMAGVGAHSGGTIKDRVKELVGIGEKVAQQQRIVAVMEAARLQAASGEDLNLRSDAAFRRFVRKNVRIKGNDKADPSLDMWGTPLSGKLTTAGLKISSAGPDKKFGTKDDVSATQNIYNY